MEISITNNYFQFRYFLEECTWMDIIRERNVQGIDITCKRNVQGTDTLLTLHVRGMYKDRHIMNITSERNVSICPY